MTWLDDHKGGGVSVYVHNSLNYKYRPYLSINKKGAESATLEILSERTRNSRENAIYIPYNGNLELFLIFSATFLSN